MDPIATDSPTRGHVLLQGWLSTRAGYAADARPPGAALREFYVVLNGALREDVRLGNPVTLYGWLACTAPRNRRVPGLAHVLAIDEITGGAVPVKAWNEPCAASDIAAPASLPADAA